MSMGFTMNGRIGRKEYLVSTLVIVLLTYAAGLVFGFAAGVSGNSVENTIALLVTMAGCFMQSALMVRRLHDIGRPGSHFWFSLIPFYNLYFGLVVLCTDGVKGANQYGPEPTPA